MTASSITCRDFVASLAEYEAREMPRRRKELFDAHLSACEKCNAYLKSYVSSIKLTRNAYSDEPRDLPADLVRAIANARRSK